MTSDTGLALYANRQGQGFVRQQIDIPALKDYYVVNAALVDLNNDGWLDIFFSTYRRGNYVIYNTGGQFTKEHLVRLPNHEDAIMSAAAAFGDVNKDGNLDIVLGNYSLGPWARDRSLLSSRNVVLLHDGERFRVQPLREIHGETFSVLLSDFNNDGNLDLIVGNDHSPPDMYYIGNGDGSFQRITRDDGLIPHSTRTTMSVASADINNDLLPEIYVGQISGNSGGDRIKNWRVGPEVCREIVHPEHKKVCEEMIAVQRSISKAHTTGDVFTCLSMEVQEYRKDCMAYHLLRQAAMQNGSQELCALFPDSYEIFSFICHHLPPQEEATSRGRAPREAEDWRQEIPSILQHNVLLMPTGDGRFVDKAREMGVQIGGWTWNAKFADVDNDEFVDLYVVNGYFPSSRHESNVFYHNQQGQRFVEHTAEAGLGSFLATSSYVYIDMDNDGDLDIIAVPVVGPILVYVNNSTTGHAIDFELRDYIGNRFGIGSKIIIHYGVNGSRHQMREIQAGGGFISYDAPMAHFGLGEFAYVERVEVLWSTGERSDIHGDFAAGSRYIITRQKPMPGVSGDNVYPKRTELPQPTNFQ